jgi:hypothetical protein
MKRKLLESLLTALIPTLRHFIERQIDGTKTQLRGIISESIEALPKAKNGLDGKSVTVEDVTPLVLETIDREMPRRADMVADVLRAVVLPAPPTAQEVAGELEKSFPTVEAVAEIARAKLSVPTAQEVAALVELPTVPTAEDVAKLVQVPSVPTIDELVEAVLLVAKIPTAKEIAELVPVPSVELPDAPTRDEVSQQIAQLKSTIPTAADVVKLVELPTLPELPQIPSAEEIAKLCVPMLPEPPSVEEVVEALKHHIPQPVKGDKGDDGTSVDMQAVMAEVTRLNESSFAKWALDFERRALDRVDAFLKAIEKPRDGKDGFGFDDITLEYDGERSFVIVMEREGKESKRFPVEMPIVIYRGVYDASEEYKRGDCVTWDGCTWIAKEATTEKPGPGQSDFWQLSVKKGRDGRSVDDPNKKGPARVRVAPRS